MGSMKNDGGTHRLLSWPTSPELSPSSVELAHELIEAYVVAAARIEPNGACAPYFVRNRAAGIQMCAEFGPLERELVRPNRPAQSTQSVCIRRPPEAAMPGETGQTLSARSTQAQVRVWG